MTGAGNSTATSPRLLSVIQQLSNKALVAPRVSRERTERVEQLRSLVLGIGLCSKGGISQGVPVDTLMILAVLCHIANTCRITGPVVLIGESMAEAMCGRMAREQILVLRRQVEQALDLVTRLLPDLRLQVILDGDVFRSSTYREAQNEIKRSAPTALQVPELRYARMQFAWHRFLEERMGPGAVKVGYTLLGPDQSGAPLIQAFREGRVPRLWCEATFDAFAYSLGETRLGGVYTSAVLPYDPDREAVCPYVAANATGRVLVGMERVGEIIPDPRTLGRRAARRIAEAIRFNHSWLELLGRLAPGVLPEFELDPELEVALDQAHERLEEAEMEFCRASKQFGRQGGVYYTALVNHAAHLRAGVIARTEALLALIRKEE